MCQPFGTKWLGALRGRAARTSAVSPCRAALFTFHGELAPSTVVIMITHAACLHFATPPHSASGNAQRAQTHAQAHQANKQAH